MLKKVQILKLFKIFFWAFGQVAETSLENLRFRMRVQNFKLKFQGVNFLEDFFILEQNLFLFFRNFIK